MTKLLIMVISIGLGSFTALAQKINADKVPAAVKASVSKAHSGVSATWEKERGNYEANFKEGDKVMSCVIDKSGTILETETDVPISGLPQTVQSYVKDHYKGARIKEASKIIKSNGEEYYEADVNGKDVLFDKNGKFIKEVKD